MGKLSTPQIMGLSKPGRYGDGDTLFLVVANTPGRSKSWIQRITVDGERRDIGLGGWPVVSLSKARQKAFKNRVAISEGRDPVAEKKQSKERSRIPIFRKAAMSNFESLKPGWRSEKVAKNWMSRMEKYVLRKIGDLRVDRIKQEDVLAILKPIWSTKPETGRRVRRDIKSTLAWCQAHEYVESNVAAEAISAALPSMKAVSKNMRSLPYQEVPDALNLVNETERNSNSVKLCLRFLVLTAARSGEARGARWSEIDLEAREWRIPGSRMKTGNEHRVPLSYAAMSVLKEAEALDDGRDLAFPSPKIPGQELRGTALSRALEVGNLIERTTVHGFRSSFRDWAAECTDADRSLMELSLSHLVGDSTERAYARSDLLAKRRSLMEAWATYVTGGSELEREMLKDRESVSQELNRRLLTR